MKDIRLVYGPRIRKARKAAGLKQIELAALLETTQETVSGWENSKVDIASERMQRISGVLAVPLGWLYGHQRRGNRAHKEADRDKKRPLQIPRRDPEGQRKAELALRPVLAD